MATCETPNNSFSISPHWRLRLQRYRLVGEVCPHCETKIFPPRDVCPECPQEPKKLHSFNSTSGKDIFGSANEIEGTNGKEKLHQELIVKQTLPLKSPSG
jgi:hypothetical protein